MKLKELRHKLAELLSDRLGTFANGQPAIWSGDSEIPKGLATGIQCNIQPVPIANRNAHPSSGGMVYVDQSWRVTLVNFDRAQTMAPVIRGIQQLSPRSVRYLPQTEKSFEQYSFEIFDPGFVSRYGFAISTPAVSVPIEMPKETRIEVQFSFGDSSPLAIGSPVKGYIPSAEIALITPFNGSPTILRMGSAANPSELIPEVTTIETESFEFYPMKKYIVETQLYLTIVRGEGCTQGSGVVFIDYSNI